jgi:hypothetical protein
MAEVENWIDSQGRIRNKPLPVKIICPICMGTGEVEGLSYPNKWRTLVACWLCEGTGWIHAKVFLKKLPRREM